MEKKLLYIGSLPLVAFAVMAYMFTAGKGETPTLGWAFLIGPIYLIVVALFSFIFRKPPEEKREE